METAVSVFLTEANSEARFGVGRSHAEDRRDPHPEDGTGPTQGYGRGHAGKITRADLAGQGRRERLPGRDFALTAPLAAAPELAESREQATQRAKAQPHHEVQAGAQQHIGDRAGHRDDLGPVPVAAPEKVADREDQIEYSVHNSPHALLSGAQPRRRGHQLKELYVADDTDVFPVRILSDD